ncbi:MAG: phosphoribosylformylglycinamidine synthase subunit PurQ [Vicinamibacteria bacterium]|nr:phosphoribosylformylglycinamidine synthase subunit PurQ [Vicinamibacteria bacterium]
MRVGVVVFPGSNCDHDTQRVFGDVIGQDARFLWHKDADLQGAEAIVIPGGFSYGDYLRTGAIARFSPVMASVKAFAEKGGRVLGICNGFQILQEAGMLDGAMLRNQHVKFLSQRVHIKVEAVDTAATRGLQAGEVLAMPIAHGDGNLYLDDESLARVEAEGRVVFRYCDAAGQVTEDANVNGSRNAIAGICNAGRNVVALMPHPERASEPILGSDQGRRILEAFVSQ